MTFSILMVVLTMSASNFSPRALAGFMRDRTNQNTLGILLGSFSFGATGILLTRLEFYDGRYLGLILLTTLVLGFLTLGALVYFIHHTATSVQITDLVLRLHHEADHALSQSLRLAESEKESNTPAVLRLFHLAVENDVVVHVLRHAGEFAARRRPLCQVWPAALVVVTLLGVLRDLASVTNDRARRQLIGKMMRAIAELALEQLSFEREREQVQHAIGRLSFDDSDMPDSVKLRDNAGSFKGGRNLMLVPAAPAHVQECMEDNILDAASCVQQKTRF